MIKCNTAVQHCCTRPHLKSHRCLLHGLGVDVGKFRNKNLDPTGRCDGLSQQGLEGTAGGSSGALGRGGGMGPIQEGYNES